MWEHFCLVGPHHVLEVHRPGGGWVQRWESKQLVPARGLQGGYAVHWDGDAVVAELDRRIVSVPYRRMGPIGGAL